MIRIRPCDLSGRLHWWRRRHLLRGWWQVGASVVPYATTWRECRWCGVTEV